MRDFTFRLALLAMVLPPSTGCRTEFTRPDCGQAAYIGSDADGRPFKTLVDDSSDDFSKGTLSFESGARSFTSRVHDTGTGTPVFFTLSCTCKAPVPMKLRLRSAASPVGLQSATWYGPTSNSDDYELSSSASNFSSPINKVHDGDRYIQYKYQVTSSHDLGSTPVPDLGSTPVPDLDLGSTPVPDHDLGSTPVPDLDLGSTPVPDRVEIAYR